MIYIIIIAFIVDISIVRITTSIGGIGQSYITLFAGTVLVFAVGQYTILTFVKSEHKVIEHKVSSNITGRRLIDIAVTVIQYALLAILASVIYKWYLHQVTMF